MAMRLHISLEGELVDALDARVGRRGRSAFIAATIRQAVDDQWRWEEIEAALDSLQGSQHVWDPDPAGWVRNQRLGDRRRVGSHVAEVSESRTALGSREQRKPFRE